MFFIHLRLSKNQTSTVACLPMLLVAIGQSTFTINVIWTANSLSTAQGGKGMLVLFEGRLRKHGAKDIQPISIKAFYASSRQLKRLGLSRRAWGVFGSSCMILPASSIPMDPKLFQSIFWTAICTMRCLQGISNWFAGKNPNPNHPSLRLQHRVRLWDGSA